MSDGPNKDDHKKRRIQSHRDLIVWQKAVELVVDCYRTTKRFPDAEWYGLTSQLQRAAVSVPANIAEGKGRGTTNLFKHFLAIASGSLTELDTHLEIAQRLGYLSDEAALPLFARISEVGRMLTALRKSLGGDKDSQS